LAAIKLSAFLPKSHKKMKPGGTTNEGGRTAKDDFKKPKQNADDYLAISNSVTMAGYIID
jgi:hypothetical protein